MGNDVQEEAWNMELEKSSELDRFSDALQVYASRWQNRRLDDITQRKQRRAKDGQGWDLETCPYWGKWEGSGARGEPVGVRKGPEEQQMQKRQFQEKGESHPFRMLRRSRKQRWEKKIFRFGNSMTIGDLSKSNFTKVKRQEAGLWNRIVSSSWSQAHLARIQFSCLITLGKWHKGKTWWTCTLFCKA